MPDWFKYDARMFTPLPGPKESNQDEKCPVACAARGSQRSGRSLQDAQETLRSDSDDDHRDPVNDTLFPNHRGIATEGLHPVAMTKNGGPLRLRGLIVGCNEEPAGGW